jgi:hypothetical protein
VSKTLVTRWCHKHSTGRTVLPFGLNQPEEQPRLLQQLPRFYLVPFPRKKSGDLRALMHPVLQSYLSFLQNTLTLWQWTLARAITRLDNLMISCVQLDVELTQLRNKLINSLVNLKYFYMRTKFQHILLTVYSRTFDCEQLGLRVFYKTSKNFEGIVTW